MIHNFDKSVVIVAPTKLKINVTPRSSSLIINMIDTVFANLLKILGNFFSTHKTRK